MTLFEEVCNLTKLQPQAAESYRDFVWRLVRKIKDLSDADWETLSKKAQDWNNLTVTKLNDADETAELPPLDGYIPADDAAEDEVEVDADGVIIEPEPEVEEDGPAEPAPAPIARRARKVKETPVAVVASDTAVAVEVTDDAVLFLHTIATRLDSMAKTVEYFIAKVSKGKPIKRPLNVAVVSMPSLQHVAGNGAAQEKQRHPYDEHHPLLALLSATEPMPVAEIAASMGSTEGAIRQQLFKLSARGFVRNVPYKGYCAAGANKAPPKKAAVAEKAVKAKNAGKGKVKQGRPGPFPADAKLTVLAKDNPKKAGTSAAKRFTKYAKCKTVADALKAGFSWRDLRMDTEHKYISVA